MEKTNTPKEEKYWYLHFGSRGISVMWDWKDNSIYESMRKDSNNYFCTEKEAEVMADKLCRVLKGAWVIDPPETESFAKKVEAVLNGAEVIEMPSVEKISERATKFAKDYSRGKPREGALALGVLTGVGFITSKIVK